MSTQSSLEHCQKTSQIVGSGKSEKSQKIFQTVCISCHMGVKLSSPPLQVKNLPHLRRQSEIVHLFPEPWQMGAHEVEAVASL